MMAMDASRTGDRYVVRFDLPGIDPSTIDDGVLTIVIPVSSDARPRQVQITTSTGTRSGETRVLETSSAAS
jgi:HSP20 family molecular chaperone IbpA